MASQEILLVSYSLGGHTEAAALAIAERLGSAHEAIDAPAIGRGLAGVVRALWSALRRTRPPLAPARHDPASYSLVVVAAPIWAGRPATPALSYLATHAAALPAVAFVLTHGGSDPTRAFEMLAAAAGKAPLARLALSEAERKSGADAAKVEDFVAELTAAAGGARGASCEDSGSG